MTEPNATEPNATEPNATEAGGTGAGAAGSGDDPNPAPALRIISGNPSPAEVAAVTVVLTLLSGGAETPAEPEPSAWSDLSLRLRRPLPPGPDSWRNSAWQ